MTLKETIEQFWAECLAQELYWPDLSPSETIPIAR